MRCLTLADELRQRGAEVFFVCREHSGNLVEVLQSKGYAVHCLPSPDGGFTRRENDAVHSAWLGVPWEQDAMETAAVLGMSHFDWLVVDHYALDLRWERKLRPRVGKIMVIDDLADRPHDCELLLDQNLYKDMYTRYNRLVPEFCMVLAGPSHALLRPEFVEARSNLPTRDGKVGRILIFFGGIDLENETEKAMAALKLLNRNDIAVDLVVGGASPHIDQLRQLCLTTPNSTFHCQVGHMAELMKAADMAIGAGGSTMWERCCLGLPTVVMTIADNQVQIAKECAWANACFYLGNARHISSLQLAAVVEELLLQPEQLEICSEKAVCLVDGLGVDRVVEQLLK